MNLAQRMETCLQAAKNARASLAKFRVASSVVVLLVLLLARPAASQVPPQILVQPQDQYACPLSDATFYVEADGSQPLSFDWFINGAETTNGVVSTTTNSSLTIAGVQPSDDGSEVHVLVSNPFGTNQSNSAFLHVPPAPFISQEPQDQIVPPGGTFSFHVAAGPGPLAYQWWFRGSPLANGLRVMGANTPDLIIANAQLSDAGYYRALVLNDCIVVDSLSARCDVGNPPVITNQPLNQTAPFQSPVQFSVGASGALFYQWYRNDVAIPGAINPSLTLPVIRRPQVGVYHVTLGNGAGLTSSSRVQLQIELTLGTAIIPRQEATDFIDSLTNAQRLFAPPPTVISHGVPLLFSTYGATAQAWETSRCGVPPSHSMWLLYYSPRAESTIVSTEGSDFSTVVGVYSWNGNTSDNPVQIACDVHSGYGGRSRLSFPALARTDYYVAVDGVGGASGTARLQVGEIIRKPQYNPTNGTFSFEMAGPYWYAVTLQSSTNLAPPAPPWQTVLTVPATNQDYVAGYTNTTAGADSQRFYRTGVDTNSLPP
ncbi:MAG TPA: immunoglobulin domain-containing protein [Candidatus Binatia bacterium]|jgi:hypothetical protein|nr:immunoglobulin domain-containing protein [Candidatus Binatia bacterium]